MLFGQLEEQDNYLYHYTSAARMADILESGVIRLSSYMRTNDPLESRTWNVMLEAEGWDDGREWPTLLSDIRETVKIACFTIDSPRDDGQKGFLLDRGWARGRMWSQYGSNHSGACLVLDKKILDTAFTRLLDSSSEVGRHGSVLYSDATFSGALAISVHAIEDFGEKDAVKAFIADRADSVFFKKNLDWESEHEYRYLITSDADFEVLPISVALKGIVVGQSFPASELNVLSDRLRRLQTSNVDVAHLNWIDGRPLSVFDGATGLQLPILEL